jgi:hypothetical protein
MNAQAPQGAIVCREPSCERAAVVSAAFCRIHLVESLRREGTFVPFEDPELSGVWATVVHFARTTLDGLPPELLEPHVPTSGIDLCALFQPDDDWPLAQLSLDLLGTFFADEFGYMELEAPMEFQSRILLRLRVAVPAPAADEFVPRLRSAMEALFREVVGPDVSPGLSVALAEDSDGS